MIKRIHKDAVDNGALEAGGGGVRGIGVQRVVVPAQLSKGLHLLAWDARCVNRMKTTVNLHCDVKQEPNYCERLAIRQ